MQPCVIERSGLEALLALLRGDGHRVVGPTLRDGAIVYGDVESLADLPEGWTDDQEAGRYRLARRNDAALFGYVVGPHSWKQFLHPPRARLFEAHRESKGLVVEAADDAPPKLALIGVRACELAAIAIQDRVLMDGPHADPIYRERRAGAFIIAVNCVQAGGTCFCVSMDTGPRATRGFDLALTELIDADGQRFLVEPGTERGATLLARVQSWAAEGSDLDLARERIADAAASMGRRLETADLPGLLSRNLEHPRWDEVASRCLACANCTMACPTCFCTTVEDTTDLTGEHASRWRHWSSCFELDFSYIHGGPVRASGRSRYRQWMTHKLSTWHDQFGSSGCVGCGRCITWCPVGIDITEEARAIRETDGATAEPRHERT